MHAWQQPWPDGTMGSTDACLLSCTSPGRVSLWATRWPIVGPLLSGRWKATCDEFGLQLTPHTLVELAGTPPKALLEILTERSGKAPGSVDSAEVRPRCKGV